jgi:hypothetical protein
MSVMAFARPVAMPWMRGVLRMRMVFMVMIVSMFMVVVMIMIMIMIMIVIVIVLRGAVLVCHERFSMLCEAGSCLRCGVDYFNGDV